MHRTLWIGIDRNINSRLSTVYMLFDSKHRPSTRTIKGGTEI